MHDGNILSADQYVSDGGTFFMRLGREVERRVLARAVRLHLEVRILVDGDRPVVFE